VTTLALSALFALLLWWASTGIVLYLDQRPRPTHARSLRGASIVGGLALVGLVATRDLATVGGACVAFTCAVLVWGWHEMSFLTGRVTGPRRHACADGCRGVRHFGHAVEAIIHHELALAATLALVVALAWNATNWVGAATFALLWTMRLSAKLNLFLGVRNPGTELLPAHLRYLASFFGRRPVNALLPVSVAATALLVAWLARSALVAVSAFEATAYGLVAALAALALLEHLFLILPWSVARLWGWSGDPAGTGAAPAPAAAAVGASVLPNPRPRTVEPKR
jgi:putative photosynthetic complex assembly protein 2